jgi:hypothetical protein
MSEQEVKNREAYLAEVPKLQPDTIEFLTKYIGLPEDELKEWMIKTVGTCNTD